MKQKVNISIQLQASNVTNGFDLGHDLDIWIFKVKCDVDHSVTKVICKDLPDSDRGDFSCRRAVDSSSLILISIEQERIRKIPAIRNMSTSFEEYQDASRSMD